MTDREFDRCAKLVCQWITALDPTWAVHLEVMRTERGFSDRQILGACVAIVMDQGLQMSVLASPVFESGAGTLDAQGQKTCPVCHRTWTPQWQSQPVCSNACAAQYYPPSVVVVPKLLPEAERRPALVPAAAMQEPDEP